MLHTRIVLVATPGALATLAALAGACASASGSAADPGMSPVVAAPANPDAVFMGGMIGHHAQALAMTHLVAARTTALDVRTLAERIAASQRTEIALMARWLVARGHAVPDTTQLALGHHVAHLHMPGMLSPGQMDQLRAARGPAFDRLFLALMIQHHRGALEMVQQLLAQPGGGQDAEARRFASDVDADQRAEIARMERMLAARGSP